MATTGNRSNKALNEVMIKTQLLNALSESTGLQKKDVALVLDELRILIERHIKRRTVGTFTLPGLLKIKAVGKPATKSRKMISPSPARKSRWPQSPLRGRSRFNR